MHVRDHTHMGPHTGRTVENEGNPGDMSYPLVQTGRDLSNSHEKKLTGKYVGSESSKRQSVGWTTSDPPERFFDEFLHRDLRLGLANLFDGLHGSVPGDTQRGQCL